MSGSPRLVVNERVLGRVHEDVSGNPEVEVGGRWVGHFLDPGQRPSQRGLRTEGERETCVILDYIPMGPNPEKSTATELQPDRNYQLWTLRKLQEADPLIEVLGSWHSHVPNGLGRFSNVDVSGYHAKINDPSQPYPFTGIVCSLIHTMPPDPQSVRGALGHAWFPVGAEVGEHTWFDEQGVEWADMEVPSPHLLDLADHSAYLAETGASALGLDDWARAIDRVARSAGAVDHDLRRSPSGDRLILIESLPGGTDYAVEIGPSGEVVFHQRGGSDDSQTPMSSVEDAFHELEDRLRARGAICAPWSHVNSTLARSLGTRTRPVGLWGWISGLLGR